MELNKTFIDGPVSYTHLDVYKRQVLQAIHEESIRQQMAVLGE